MVGETVNHYKIIGKIGEGGMGDVYKARDLKLDRLVALKFLPPHLSRDKDGKKRFIQEAKAISALDHPNICTIFEIGETDDGQLFIAMAYYKGRSLREILDDGPIPIQKAVDIALKIARGLASVHKKDITHRDIKPANILITDDGRVKIIDFGLAKLAGRTTLTKEGSTLGTVAYMSPEQTTGSEVDHRSDIWSLGVVLYEMVAGKRPFEGNYEQAIIFSILNEDPADIRKENGNVSDELVQIITNALQKDPAQRYETTDQLLNDLQQFKQDRLEGPGKTGLAGLKRNLREPEVVLTIIGLFTVLVLGAVWFINRQSDIQWAKSEALPQIEYLVETNWRDYTDAYKLAARAEEYIPDDPKLSEILAQITLEVNISTDPAGADIYYKEYDSPESDWEYLGVSPLEGKRMPVGIFRLKITREGYQDVYAVASTWTIDGGDPLLSPNTIARKLDREGSIPKDMVRVPETATPSGEIPGFLIDKYEVTNKEFKTFIDSGGYTNPEYWKHPFIKDGQSLSFDETMALFTDKTGRPGPSTWEAGDFPEGEENHPVNGISWYEADAYAAFAGKSLPTHLHWDIARGKFTPIIRFPQLGGFAIFAPFSNFGSDGPVPSGSMPGITSYGAYDMAGNVREWCWNETPKGRLIRGGAWNDNTYMFGNLSQAPPFDRSVKNGFRCVIYPDRQEIPATVFDRVNYPDRPNFYEMEPVSDEIFQVYKQQFSYDKTGLNVKEISREEDHEDWVFERVSYDAPYGDERIIANLFLPKNTEPPYQTVIYFPGSGSLLQTSSEDLENYFEFPVFLRYLVKNGRAVVYPVYKGTFERSNNRLLAVNRNPDSHRYTEFVIQLVKDFKRTVDYLETRDDIDTGKLAYYGMSWGGMMGAIIPAVEDRLQASVLVPGALLGEARPEVNQVNYVGRVTIPTLMLNGKYDTLAPLETAIKPMYDLLGTPGEHKKLILYETDHIPPKTEFIKETLNWYDRYLGPVQ